MADIHVLGGDGLSSWTFVFHYAVPNTDNTIGVSYRTALVNSGLGGSSAMVEGVGPGCISTAELALIATGELYEYQFAFLAESGAVDNAQMLAEARVAYAREQARMWTLIQRQLKYYGFEGSKA